MIQKKADALMNKNINKIYKVVTYVILAGMVSYIIMMLVNMTIAACSPYPREYRDASNVMQAWSFANYTSPYNLANAVTFGNRISAYTPMNNIIASLIYKISPFSMLNVLLSLDYIYILITAIIIVVYSKKSNSELSILPLSILFLSSLTLGFRGSDFIQTVPDHLGMLIVLCIIIMVSKGKNIIIPALLTVLCFYVKQYFIVVGFTVSVYYFLRDKKKLLLYWGFGSIFGIGSLFLIKILQPTFFIETIFFFTIENSERSMDNIIYMIKQFCFIFILYLPFWIPFLLDIFSRFKNKKKMSIFQIHGIVMFIALIYLGMNQGAFLSYHMALMMPSVLIAGIINVDKDKIKTYVPAVAIYVLLVFLWKFGLPYVITSEDRNNYKKAYDIIEKYQGEPCYIFYTLACKEGMDNGINIIDNGHSDYFTFLYEDGLYGVDIDYSFYEKVFPELGTVLDKANERREVVKDYVENKKFALIVKEEGVNEVEGTKFDIYYDCIETIPLHHGKFVADYSFWIPKKD